VNSLKTVTYPPTILLSDHLNTDRYTWRQWIVRNATHKKKLSLLDCNLTPSRPFFHWGDATAIRSRKKSTTLNSWRVVIASWSRRWGEVPIRIEGSTSRRLFFLDGIAVASPQWENGLRRLLSLLWRLWSLTASSCSQESAPALCPKPGESTLIFSYLPIQA
jgi:hypothetical protein